MYMDKDGPRHGYRTMGMQVQYICTGAKGVVVVRVA
jgi:hypothetical protein